jgi:hypothetical protein
MIMYAGANGGNMRAVSLAGKAAVSAFPWGLGFAVLFR